MRPCGFMPPGRFCVLMGLLRVMLARSHSPVPLPAAFVSVTRQPTTETEVNMAIINLRDYYPFYTSDCFMEVSEEVAEMLWSYSITLVMVDSGIIITKAKSKLYSVSARVKPSPAVALVS